MSRYAKKKHLGEKGVDDWLMTYADMITLLICFFAVFLSVSVPKEEAFEQARSKVLEKFSTPNPNQSDYPHKPADPRSNVPYDKLPSIVDQYLKGETEGEGQVIHLGRKDEGEKKAGETIKLKDGASKPRPEGDRLKTFEVPSAAFFASGSATISDEGKKLLQAMIDGHLSKAEMKDFSITVEGHTDDAPIATTQFPSNWELSTARAASVVRVFIEKGIDPKRLRAAGYADVLPKLPNRDASGKMLTENQAKNRRVVIKLEKIEKDN